MAVDLQELMDKVQAEVSANSSQWLAVAFVTFFLLRQGLILFACATPVMAYMYLSNRQDEAEAGEPAEAGGGANADGAEPWPPGDDDEDEVDFRPPPRAGAGRGAGDGDEVDPYDQSFWSQGDGDGPGSAPEKAAAPWRGGAPPKKEPDFGDDDDDSLGLGPSPPPRRISPKDDLDGEDILGSGAGRKPMAPMSDNLDDFLGNMGGGGKSSGGGFGLGGGGGLDDDFDFLGGGRDDDMDFLGGGRPKGKGKGKGKGDKGDKGGKDPNAPREPNPKQVFVANVGEMEEDEIQQLFEEVGEVDRLKVLRQDDGSSKGVCFVTFRTEDQAQDALKLHGRPLDGGKNLVVRLAHGGNKGEKGDKGGSKGDKGDRPLRMGGDRFGNRDDGPLDLGGSERFGAAFGFGRDRDRDDRGPGDRGGFGDRGGGGFGDRGGGGGKGKGKGGKGGRQERGEMDEILEEALADGDGPLRATDFDFAARRFLAELKTRDKQDGTSRLQEALDMVLKYTSSKERSSVRKWPAYVFTLLQKFDTGLWEELRERDAARKAEKGDKGAGRRQISDDD